SSTDYPAPSHPPSFRARSRAAAAVGRRAMHTRFSGRGPSIARAYDSYRPIVHDGDELDLSRIRQICFRFPEVEEAILQDRPLFRVRHKRFALFNGTLSPPRPRWQAFGRSLHFVTEPGEREALRQDPRFCISPHHGDCGWMALDLQDA